VEISTQTQRFTNPLYLESGRIIEPYELIYETYGELNEQKSNVVVITHALSGSHHAAGFYEGDKKPGWWDSLIGEGKSVDTSRYFVICVNVIGSCFGSTGPMSPMYPSLNPYRFRFPVVTIRDMVRAQKILFGMLGIDRVKAIIGGSMGGMQALVFAVDYPNFAEHIIPMATTHATRPAVIAANKIMSEAIRSDPAFREGNYDPRKIQEEGCAGLSVARMLGFMHYLSPRAMEQKFGRNYVQNDGLYELFGRFEVERYLEYNGYNFPKYFDPLSYLYIIKAISIFDLSFGFDSLAEALERVKSHLHLIPFSGDRMFFSEEMGEIEQAMREAGKGHLCSLYEVESDYGHDSFLVEVEKYGDYVREILS